MGRKINSKDIYNINKLYLQYNSYKGVADYLGISSGTVKKYIINGFKLEDEAENYRAAADDLEDLDDFADWEA